MSGHLVAQHSASISITLGKNPSGVLLFSEFELVSYIFLKGELRKNETPSLRSAMYNPLMQIG